MYGCCSHRSVLNLEFLDFIHLKIFITVLACDNIIQGIKTWNVCVKVEIKRFGLVKEDAHYRNKWRSLTTGSRLTLPQCGKEG